MAPAIPFFPQASTSTRGMPEVREEDGALSLYLGGPTLQSRSVEADPTRLVLEYTRVMMGFLLFHPAPRRIGMIGLGGGSLAKYCHAALPEVDFTAVEIVPEVVALRDVFGVPADGPRFRVLCEDGAAFVGRDDEPYDVLLVDGFDDDGQPDELCSTAFYDACAVRLDEGGVLVVNLHADEPDYEIWLEHLREAFEGRIVVATAEESENGIVFAGADPDFPPPFQRLVANLRALGAHESIELDATLRKIAAYRPPGSGPAGNSRHAGRLQRQARR